ncbi:hypothetical protein DMA11_00275 [Marinilabiliaceae bacterium JC017]|nr:hypothetical protein DMA11_00275 [Marinilabiliaceae bacterium JC017]
MTYFTTTIKMKKLITLSIILMTGFFVKAQSNDELLETAIKALDKGRNVTAMDLFSSYIEKEKSNPTAYFGRAKATYWVWRLRDQEDSTLLKSYLSDIYTSFELDSTNSDCNYWIAENIEKSKDLNNAITYYNRAIKYDGERERFYRSRAYCYMNLGLFSKAIEDFKLSNKLLDKDIKKSLEEDNFSKMSLCYAKIDNFNQAITSIKKSIKSNPTNNIYRLYYATYLALLDKPQKSLKTYNHLITKNPYLGIAHLFIGNIYNNENKKELAESHYSKARELGFEVNEKTKSIKNQVDLLLYK